MGLAKTQPKLNKKLKKGKVDCKSSDRMLVLKWKDRRDVTMITTLHKNKIVATDKTDKETREFVKKPICIVDYNDNMGATDRADMMVSSIECMRKSVKCYKKLFFHTLDLLVLNLYAMQLTQRRKRTQFADFQLKLIRQIFEK